MATPIEGPEPPKDCPLCPRLVAYRQEAQARFPDGWNGAVPSWGDPEAKLLVVGLAPGLQGANLTGRPFTGDWAGDLLYSALGRAGFTRGIYDRRPDDGLKLFGAMITNAVRCVPPANKPVAAEVNTCRAFLVERMRALPELRVLLCLGKVSHDSTVRALGLKVSAHRFGHASEYAAEVEGKPIVLLSSYHCSRYNTNTGRLTADMFQTVMDRARTLIDARPG